MTIEIKKRLLDMLSETRSATQAVLEGSDLEMRVFTDGDWRIRDLLGHIATWDRETTKSLRSFMQGSEYLIQGFEEDDFNQNSVLEQRKMSTEDILTEWEQAREDLKSAVEEIPLDKFSIDFLAPWGDDLWSATQMVDYFIEHEDVHRAEIEKALQANT